MFFRRRGGDGVGEIERPRDRLRNDNSGGRMEGRGRYGSERDIYPILFHVFRLCFQISFWVRFVFFIFPYCSQVRSIKSPRSHPSISDLTLFFPGNESERVWVRMSAYAIERGGGKIFYESYKKGKKRACAIFSFPSLISSLVRCFESPDSHPA